MRALICYIVARMRWLCCDVVCRMKSMLLRHARDAAPYAADICRLCYMNHALLTLYGDAQQWPFHVISTTLMRDFITVITYIRGALPLLMMRCYATCLFRSHRRLLRR